MPKVPLIFRSFWHGRQLGPYETLCLRTIVAKGHRFELFTYDDAVVVPNWVCRRDARDILPMDHVMVYHHGSGAGGPALHSNLFRYKLMHEVGGWWLDLDVLLMEGEIPRDEAFFAADARGLLVTAILKFPKGHRLLADAIARCLAVPEHEAKWGQTGPDLINELVDAHGLRAQVQPFHTVYPLDFNEVVKLFDPSCFDEVLDRSRSSPFFHTFHEFRRASGFPSYAGPPEGSFLDFMFKKYELPPRTSLIASS